MGGVNLSHQMKVTNEVDRQSKFRFYLRVFFDFLDIAVVNSNIVYNKIASTPSMTSLNFQYSIAQNMIQKFSGRKRAAPLSRPSKRSRGQSFDIVTTYQILPPLEFVVPCVHQRKWRIEHMCTVLLAMLHFIFKKTVIAFNNTMPSIDFLPLSNKYFMHW